MTTAIVYYKLPSLCDDFIKCMYFISLAPPADTHVAHVHRNVH